MQITSKDSGYSLVEHWKSKRFGDELSLKKVVVSLGSSEPMVRLNSKRGSSRHVVCLSILLYTDALGTKMS